jgi:hypothetical protein
VPWKFKLSLYQDTILTPFRIDLWNTELIVIPDYSSDCLIKNHSEIRNKFCSHEWLSRSRDHLSKGKIAFGGYFFNRTLPKNLGIQLRITRSSWSFWTERKLTTNCLATLQRFSRLCQQPESPHSSLVKLLEKTVMNSICCKQVQLYQRLSHAFLIFFQCRVLLIG